MGLARQIADEVACAQPGQLVPFEASANLVFTSSAVMPYLQADALADLRTVAQTHTLQINSAYRTVAQQYLLHRWDLENRCGITTSAPVGTSNHETGRALDLSNYPLAALTENGWSHDIPGDAPHFDHLASPDLRGEDTRAFQRLWNRNHPEDPMVEDGIYGAETEQRLRASPATGFAIGADCGAPEPLPSGERIALSVAIDGPDRAPPATRVHYQIGIANVGDVDWSTTARLVVASDQASLLHDPSWLSTTAVTTLGTGVPAGEIVWVDFDVATPAVTAETVLHERLTLDDDGVRFGEIDIALTVVPGSTDPESGEGTEPEQGQDAPPMGGGGSKGDSDPPSVTGGCAAGSGTGGLAIGLVLVGLLRRRR